MQAIYVLIYGYVQGVFFRASARDKALNLGLTGYVRNLPDGSVELEAEGEDDSLRELISWCHHGPPAARVERVEVSWGEATGRWREFAVRG
ncbi:MAG: acylphosphatase [Candidatus Bipolaricaulota bacterium]